MDFPQFKRYYLSSDNGQPIESVFLPLSHAFLAFDDAKESWGILQIFPTLDETWLPFFEGQARSLGKQADNPMLLPIHEVGMDDGMLYMVRPLTRSESIQSYLARSGTLPWHIGAALVRDLVSTLIELKQRSPLFGRVDLSTLRVLKTAPETLTLELPSCHASSTESTEQDRIREVCLLVTRMTDIGSAPNCADQIIATAYGTKGTHGVTSLEHLLLLLAPQSTQSLWSRVSTSLPYHARDPESSFDHPQLATFRQHFERDRLNHSLTGNQTTVVIPFTTTTICLFAVGLTTSVWAEASGVNSPGFAPF